MAIYVSPHLAHVTLLAAVLASGCDSKSKEATGSEPAVATISAEDRALLDQLKAKEKARGEQQTSPDKFIESESWAKHDKGIIGDYSQATALGFTNKSQFDDST